MIGTVSWFNNLKGYGFISPDDNPKSLVYLSHREQEFQTNDRVEFTVSPGDRGPVATEIRLLVPQTS